MKKKFAVYTICKNEKTFLPIWLKHYSRFCPLEDMYVIDHQSDDGSTDNLPCNHVVWDHPIAFDHAAVTNRVKSMQVELLERYENVLLTEIDEIIFAREGLDKYVENFVGPAVKCNGFDILHMPSEAPIDLSRPILQQRKFWFYSPVFQCKPYLSKVPLDWEYGYHQAKGVTQQDPNLFLLHLNRFDYGMAYERNLERQAMKIHQGDKAAGYGFQKHLQGEEFKNWFYNFRNNQPVVEIPQWIRDSEMV